MSDLELMASLRALTMKARQEKKWLYSNSLAGEFWFSPDQLDAENRRGCFRWGVDNWQLRDPMERVMAAKQRADAAIDEYNRIRKECLCPVLS